MKNKISCVLMAAGESKRFGENKLEKTVNGQTLIEHSLSVIPTEFFEKIIVVSGQEKILKNAAEIGFSTVVNNEPKKGLSHTIQLGLSQCKNCDGVMFLVSDQPYLKKDSIIKLVEEFENNPDRIIALKSNKRRGNPCIFPKSFFDELFMLSGDVGGSEIIRKNESSLILVNADEIELIDIDTKDDLLKLT